MRFLRLCTILTLLAPPAPAIAADAPDTSAERGATAPQLQRHRVEVVFVGQTADAAALLAVVDELLTPRGDSITRRTQASMSEAEWLESSESSDRGATRVWITLPTPNLARIWFAVPSEKRYLWRELKLENGLDALGCEQIAQVVQSSTEALSQGNLGHSRAQARRAWQEREVLPSGSLGRPNRTRENRVTIRDGRVSVRALAKKRWQPHLGVGYGIVWTGSHLEWLHGPTIEVGLDRLSGVGAFGLHVAAERHFGQSFENYVAALELQSTAGWLLLHWRDTSTSMVQLAARFGFGTEVTDVRPGAPDVQTAAPQASAFVPKDAYVNFSYWLRLRAGTTGRMGPLHWDASGGVDLSLSDTSYNYRKGGSSHHLVEPWPVRPGVELGISWR